MMLIPVKDKQKLQAAGIYFTPGTLRRWHCQGINLRIFVKLGGSLFVDLDRWNEFVKEARHKSDQRAERFERITGISSKISTL